MKRKSPRLEHEGEKFDETTKCTKLRETDVSSNEALTVYAPSLPVHVFARSSLIDRSNEGEVTNHKSQLAQSRGTNHSLNGGVDC